MIRGESEERYFHVVDNAPTREIVKILWVEILVTLAVVTGGYALAGRLHTSGPIAEVVAGIMIGNQGRLFAMSDRTREHLDTFWLAIDETLNAILFVLIGLEVLVIRLNPDFVAAGLLAIPVALAARALSVSLPIGLLRLRAFFIPYTIRIMTWGGLHGGIAIALALSIPANPHRNLVVVMMYAMAVLSILVQGLTVAPLATRTMNQNEEIAGSAVDSPIQSRAMMGWAPPVQDDGSSAASRAKTQRLVHRRSHPCPA